ncbi:unnamed protein product, partial [Durusdinium trenchii]
QEILAEERSGRQEDKLEGAAARGQRNTDEFEKACREEARWKEEVLQRQICNLKQELLEAERFARVEDIQTKGSQRKTDEFEKACRQEAGEMVVEVHEAVLEAVQVLHSEGVNLADLDEETLEGEILQHVQSQSGPWKRSTIREFVLDALKAWIQNATPETRGALMTWASQEQEPKPAGWISDALADAF